MEKKSEIELQFGVIKYWVNDYFEQQICYFFPDQILPTMENPDLSDARCLIRMVKKEVDNFNSQIRKKQKLLKNLQFKANYLSSNIFTGISIPVPKIQRLIKGNPDKSAFDIYQMLRVE